MTVPDFSQDFRVMDNLETIQYYVKISDGVYAAPVTIPFCLRRMQSQSLDDYSQVNTLNWHIWNYNIPSPQFIPKTQDLIYATSDNSYWIIEPVDYATWVTRYRCPCKRKIG